MHPENELRNSSGPQNASRTSVGPEKMTLRQVKKERIKIAKKLQTVRQKRNMAANQLRHEAVSAIRTIEKEVNALIGSLQGIKDILIAEVLRKTYQAVRRQMATQEYEQTVTLIAPQLLELVAQLHQPIKVTCDKLRTLTITSQVILSIGGDASGVTRDAIAYDPVSQKLTQACSMHRKRQNSAATNKNGKVVVAGGSTDESECDRTVEEYDPVSNSWSWLSNLLVGRCDHALVNVNDCIYALGGHTETSYSTATVEKLDITATQWTNFQPMSIARQGLVAVALHVSSKTLN